MRRRSSTLSWTWWALITGVVGSVVAVAVVGTVLQPSPTSSTGTTAPDPSPPSPPPALPSCLTNDPLVPDPGGPHGLFVLNPPNGPHNAYYGDVQEYLLHNPALCGADFWVPWSSVDQGPGSSPEFNFSAVDANAAPWIAAGKQVNLIFEMIGGTPNYVPASVLASVPTFSCGGSVTTPVEWNATFEQDYQQFIAAAVHHFDAERGFGYIRFDLSVSGSLAPVDNIDASGCNATLTSYGFNLGVWTAYLDGMLNFQHSLAPSVGLITPISPVYPNAGDNVSGAISAVAAADGIGIGSEGLRANDSSGAVGGIGCGGHGWCYYFAKYAGIVPLELQTEAASSPNGSGPVGSLTQLLPFGLSQRAQVFELYLDDWLTAFDPNYPAYAEYHAEYGAAINETADEVGFVPSELPG